MVETIAHLNIEALRALPDDLPVTMLNLMRLRDHSRDGKGSGWEAYLRYSALSIKLIKGVGGTIVWTGEAQAVARRARGASLGLRRTGALSILRRLPWDDEVAGLPARQCRA
jgi:hypothetical protein